MDLKILLREGIPSSATLLACNMFLSIPINVSSMPLSSGALCASFALNLGVPYGQLDAIRLSAIIARLPGFHCSNRRNDHLSADFREPLLPSCVVLAYTTPPFLW